MIRSTRQAPLNRLQVFGLIVCSILNFSAPANAGLKDDIGYTQLLLEEGAGLPDGSSVPVTQAEAATAFVVVDEVEYPVYLPDPSHSQFTGKSILVRSGSQAGTFSSHGTNVGKTFYGSTSSVAPGIALVDAYWADDWLQSGFLNVGAAAKPLISSSRIANHSWIGEGGDAQLNSDLLRRTDWVIETDEYMQCVGIKNNASPNLAWLSGAYNTIAVGKSDGLNGYGTADIDADYVAGRTRPELVAPTGYSSNSTPVVAASAALLVDYGHSNPGLATDPVETSTVNRYGDVIYNTGRSEVIKALLMAGADRFTANTAAADIDDYRVAPTDQTVNGLDRRFGAGQVNLYNSFKAMQAGEQNSGEDSGGGNIVDVGFDYDPSFGGSDGSNSTASYYFSTNTAQKMLSTTLAWNIDIDGGNGPSFSGTAELYDMDLSLYDITGDTVLVASSSSTVDNSETIWIVLPADRDYLLQVAVKPGQDAFDWDYALAWHMVNLLDSDDDGIPDINDTDDDNDGLSDVDEVAAGTDPLDSDTDNDLFMDGTEVLAGTNPLVSSDYPEWGDIDGDDTVTIADLLLASRAAVGLINLDAAQLARGNVAPLVNGVPQSLPTDNFNMADLLLIQRKILGELAF